MNNEFIDGLRMGIENGTATVSIVSGSYHIVSCVDGDKITIIQPCLTAKGKRYLESIITRFSESHDDDARELAEKAALDLKEDAELQRLAKECSRRKGGNGRAS